MENKPRLNLIDGLIILIIAIVLAVGIYFIAGRNGSAGSDENASKIAEYKIQFVEREKVVADMFTAAKENGETVWVGEKERAEAVITDVLIELARKQTTDAENEKVVMAEIPELYDVTVTLRSAGQETETEIHAGGTAIHVGEETSVKGKGFAGYGFVTDLKLID